MKLKPEYTARILVQDGSAQVEVTLGHNLIQRALQIDTSHLMRLEAAMIQSNTSVNWAHQQANDEKRQGPWRIVAQFIEQAQPLRSMLMVFRPTVLLTKPAKIKVQKFSLDRNASFETEASPRVLVDALHIEKSNLRMDAFNLLASLKQCH